MSIYGSSSLQMASPQDVPDLTEAYGSAFPKSEDIWEMLESITDRSQSSGDSHKLGYLIQWFGETLDWFDNTCETLKKSEGSDWEDKLDHLDKAKLKLSLVCHHIGGSERVSFDSLISQKAIATCSYVATLISFRCFLFISGISLEKFKDTGSGSGHMSRLTDRVSSLSRKWKFNTDSCNGSEFAPWEVNIGEDEAEDAMKLLYQWVLGPLRGVTGTLITREMDKLPDRVGDLGAVACRAKWGKELCDLLVDFDEFFVDSKTVGFLLEPFDKWHIITAEHLIDLGNLKVATELLGRAKKKIDNMVEGMMYPTGLNQPIKFRPFTPRIKIELMDVVLRHLYKATRIESYLNDIEENTEKQKNFIRESLEADPEKYHSDFFSRMSGFEKQFTDIMLLALDERYSEALQKFKQLDPETRKSETCRLRGFLELLQSEQHPKHTSWESFYELQNFLLDVSEDLGDRQLTASFLQHYGLISGFHSLSRLPIQHRWKPRAYGVLVIDESYAQGSEASSLKLWFKEELNLQFPSPEPACVQEVISCLRDPCDVGEHKRELPAMLKACRLLKRSIDIYSDLLHNWTLGFSSEAEWMRLLESQRYVHDTLTSYILMIYHFCWELCMENHDVTTLNQPDASVIISGSARKVCMAFMLSALVWVERGRTRSLLSQLGRWYSTIKHGDANHSLKEELIRFDRDEKAALMDILSSCRMACELLPKPLFVEYVNLGKLCVTFVIEGYGIDEEREDIHCQEAFQVTNEDFENLQTLAGDDLVDKEFLKMEDKDLEKLAVPKTVPKLLFLFYNLIPRQQKSKNECIVAMLNAILEKLYDILIRPIWNRYAHRDPAGPLIFVPDKMLYRVPFALLRDKKTKKYLFELHTISIAPSLRVLQHCARREHDLQSFPLRQECILAVGNPAYAKAAHLISGTGTELMRLREHFQGRIKAFEAEEATRANLLKLMKEASSSEDGRVFAVMHLGVHGHWNENIHKDRFTMEHKTGSLEFAPPQTADICTEHLPTGQSHTWDQAQDSSKETILARAESKGHRSAFGEVGAITRSNSSASDPAMLPSEDIIRSGFEWRTHLAVLSACNSSRGQDFYDGEINLPRALMIAGVPAAVVSQWEIGDDVSPVLMERLYARLRTGADVASALRMAMIDFRKAANSIDDPDSEQSIFSWGSFVVWGLPSVRLPFELYNEDMKPDILEYRKVNTLLKLADNTCALDNNAIDDAIFAAERMLKCPEYCESSLITYCLIAYAKVPLEHINRVQVFLETNDRLDELLSFRRHMMLAQALMGSKETALECVELIIGCALSCDRSYDELMLRGYRCERAVIWRLMDEFDMALKEFNTLLAFGEDYECLTQMSYLKHLMGDKSGALEHARRAGNLKRPEPQRPGLWHTPVSSMTLGARALPDEYRVWLVNVSEPMFRV